jgi:hypothetical protein
MNSRREEMSKIMLDDFQKAAINAIFGVAPNLTKLSTNETNPNVTQLSTRGRPSVGRFAPALRSASWAMRTRPKDNGRTL